MRGDMDRQIQIARPPAARTGVATALHPHRVAVRDARRDAQLNRLRAHLQTGAAAWLARPRPLLSSPAARRTAPRKHHVPADGTRAACTLTDNAAARRRHRPAGAGAHVTGFTASYGEQSCDAGERLVERQLEVLMQIGATLCRCPLPRM